MIRAGAVMTTAIMYDAVIGKARPSNHTAIAVYTNARNRFAPAKPTTVQ